MMFRVQSIHVPGTRNTRNPHQHWFVPGVPGVPGFYARACTRARNHAYIARAHIRCSLSRVYTRNTRNTRNNLVTMRLSDVPGTRNKQNPTRNISMSKNLRAEMPTVAGWIDDLRAVFGAECINPSIKAGMEGQPTFHACENGIEVGTRIPYDEKNAVVGHSVALATPCDGCTNLKIKPAAPDGSRVRRTCRIYRIASGKCADWGKK